VGGGSSSSDAAHTHVMRARTHTLCCCWPDTHDSAGAAQQPVRHTNVAHTHTRLTPVGLVNQVARQPDLELRLHAALVVVQAVQKVDEARIRDRLARLDLGQVLACVWARREERYSGSPGVKHRLRLAARACAGLLLLLLLPPPRHIHTHTTTTARAHLSAGHPQGGWHQVGGGTCTWARNRSAQWP
jgi:hypothetical protein